ncbi:MAG: VRR-NUC domain-containing protein [Verrucomicrobiaceae bacterium]
MLETQERVDVTLGFQAGICNQCRNLPEESCPKAEAFGATSKIKRYYWREIYFRTLDRFAELASTRGYDDAILASLELTEEYETLERQVVEEVKIEHENHPKYNFESKSSDQVLNECSVEVERLDAEYHQVADSRKAFVLFQGQPLHVEDFVAKTYESEGYLVMKLESMPFHALFAVFLWPIVQDARDAKTRFVAFGDRNAFEARESSVQHQIWTLLPSDFGSPGFGARRATDFNDYIDKLPNERRDLLEVFDLNVGMSSDLRQYLWAHREEAIDRARKLATVLPVETIKRVLRYLANDYWGRYLGWPDLLLWKKDEVIFIEVKSSRDKLSENQKAWITDNHNILGLRFKLVKIHRKN